MGVLPLLIQNTAPIFITLFIGWLIKKTSLIDRNGIEALKKIVTRVTLPFVIFQAFFTATYNAKSILIMIIILGINILCLVIGYLLHKVFPKTTNLLPFTLSGYEMGMLGFPLFALLVGSDQIASLAIVDLGHEIFVFSIYLYLLQSSTGRKGSFKNSLIDLLRNPVMIALILGLLLGATGIAAMISKSVAGDIITGIVNFISAPTAVLILISIGYEFNIKGRLFKKVFSVLALRLILMTATCASAIFFIFKIVPFDKTLLLALMMMFILPAPFIIPVYSSSEEEADFVSAFLSTNTLVTVILFAGLILFSNLVL